MSREGFHMSDAAHEEQRKWDELFAREPAVIEWKKRTDGVWVHVSIYDPHADGGHNGTKTACKRGHPFNTTNTLITSGGHRQCRICKNLNRRAA